MGTMQGAHFFPHIYLHVDMMSLFHHIKDFHTYLNSKQQIILKKMLLIFELNHRHSLKFGKIYYEIT